MAEQSEPPIMYEIWSYEHETVLFEMVLHIMSREQCFCRNGFACSRCYLLAKVEETFPETYGKANQIMEKIKEDLK